MEKVAFIYTFSIMNEDTQKGFNNILMLVWSIITVSIEAPNAPIYIYTNNLDMINYYINQINFPLTKPIIYLRYIEQKYLTQGVKGSFAAAVHSRVHILPELINEIPNILIYMDNDTYLHPKSNIKLKNLINNIGSYPIGCVKEIDNHYDWIKYMSNRFNQPNTLNKECELTYYDGKYYSSCKIINNGIIICPNTKYSRMILNEIRNLYNNLILKYNYFVGFDMLALSLVMYKYNFIHTLYDYDLNIIKHYFMYNKSQFADELYKKLNIKPYNI